MLSLIHILVGTYAINNSMFDIGVMLIAGVVGYFMQKWEFPPSPIAVSYTHLDVYKRQLVVNSQRKLLCHE